MNIIQNGTGEVTLRDIIQSREKKPQNYENTLEKSNLIRLFEYLDTPESPLHRLTVPPSTIYGVYIHKEPLNLHICTCGSTGFVKNGSNNSGTKRHKCTNCSSSRVLSINVFNMDLAFDMLYDEKFSESCMQQTKYQKVAAFKDDKKTITFFHACIQQLSQDQLEIEEILELAFYMTCQYIEDESWKLVSQTNDDLYFLQNRYDSDVQYRLQDFIIKMIRVHNIKGSSIQDQKIPLLFCAKCRSISVQRYNFNNNGRRTIKCMECGQISIIRIINLIPQIYFDQYYRCFFQQLCDDDTTITKLIDCMREDFYNSPIYNILEEILSKQMIITTSLRNDILAAFEVIQKFRIHMSPLAFNQMESSYTDILNIPKNYDYISDYPYIHRRLAEIANKDLYNWEKRAEAAFTMLISHHKTKLITR